MSRRRDTEMSFREAVEGRRSVRRFKPDPVPREDVREMVRLATRAANAGNKQTWRFLAVEDRALLEAMRAAVLAKLEEMAAWPELSGWGAKVRGIRGYTTFFADAPLTIAALGLPYVSRGDEILALRGVSREERDHLRARPDLQSVGAAVQLLCTAAHTLGYGSCWMTGPLLAARELEALLGVEEPARLAALVPIGLAAGPTRRSPRQPVDDVLEFR